MIDLPTLDFFSRNMDANSFRFAKTMPKHPHWYTLRDKWADDAKFVKCVNLIREHGYKEYFYRTPFMRLDCNGYKYWTMGAPVDETILINRAKIEHVTDYCSFADEYDGLFSDNESQQEDLSVMDLIGDLSGKRVLDIGCGTGLLLDYKKKEISTSDYVGVDPSLPMTNVFKGKHPEYALSHVQGPFESFSKGKFDAIVSLYGSISCVNPLAMSRIKEMLNPGGFYFLMFFGEDYQPISCVKQGVTSTHYRGNWKSVIAPFQFNNFLVSKEYV